MNETAGLMEPMLPREQNGELNDLSIELIAKANNFAGKLNPIIRHAVGALVRSMNCYYSNLIEGHDTHPRDIDRALAEDYAIEPEKRALQKEAVAHITVQKMIDDEEALSAYPISAAYGQWIHKEFCNRIPDELLMMENPDTAEKIKVIPGTYRNGTVQVGQHIPPRPENLNTFLSRFDEAYTPNRLSKSQQIISVAAAHHRYLWIHPFYDGNGRVARLMSYAAFLQTGVGCNLWSIARGLARQKEQYKSLLQAADAERRRDLDGRRTLSEKALMEFCEFFLKTAMDQIEYMDSLLDFKNLSERMRIYVEEEITLKNLPKGSYSLLREALLVGEFDRGRAEELTGYKERAARNVLTTLVKKGLLSSDTPKGSVKLSFPIDVVERWFPLLYPTVGN